MPGQQTLLFIVNQIIAQYTSGTLHLLLQLSKFNSTIVIVVPPWAALLIVFFVQLFSPTDMARRDEKEKKEELNS